MTAFTDRSPFCSVFQTFQGCFHCHVHNKRVHMAPSDVHSCTKSSDALLMMISQPIWRFGHSRSGFLALCQELGRMKQSKLSLYLCLICPSGPFSGGLPFFLLLLFLLKIDAKSLIQNINERFFFFYEA